VSNQATAQEPEIFAGAADEVDPELVALPAPPKRERTATVALLLATAAASLAMVFMLRKDVGYALASPSIEDVGDIATAPRDRFAENMYIRGNGTVGAADAIRYERPFRSDTYRAFPMAGHPDVWVEVRLQPGQESARYVPPSQFAGRLVRIDSAGPKHRGLRSAIEDATGRKVPANAWLLVDGEAPQDARWAFILVGLFAAFAAWNAYSIAKLVRRVK
jgi:hypothetical protein